jgi:hypothetical protein
VEPVWTPIQYIVSPLNSGKDDWCDPGSSVQQAAKLQMTIVDVITASTTLASVFITFAAIFVLVDREHQVRFDRIENSGFMSSSGI